MNRSREIRKRLDLKDPAVRYFLRRPGESKRWYDVPKRFLGTNSDGQLRTQQEVRDVGSKVRQVLMQIALDEEKAMKEALKKIKSFVVPGKVIEDQPYTVLKDYIEEHGKNERILLIMNRHKLLKEKRGRKRALKPFDPRG